MMLQRSSISSGTGVCPSSRFSSLSILPGVIVYLICQKYFVEGIVMTGMKN